MITSHIDHLVITAPSLSVGIEYVNRTLGVSPQRGGAHARMGTHNELLKLGDSLYLEIIAVDPSASDPVHPRLFELDRLPSSGSPRLAAWVARTSDIDRASTASTLALGRIVPMTRGDLHWLITIPEDGGLPADGVAPILIQWLTKLHPAEKLTEQGCTLQQFEGFHSDPASVEMMLRSIGFEGRFSVFPLERGARPFLRAYIRTPSGVRILGLASSHT